MGKGLSVWLWQVKLIEVVCAALQVAIAPAKTRAQAANATAVYDLSKDGVLADNNTAAYKSTDALPFHVANIPDSTTTNTSSGADGSMSAVAQGPMAISAAAGSLGALIQVRTLPQAIPPDRVALQVMPHTSSLDLSCSHDCAPGPCPS